MSRRIICKLCGESENSIVSYWKQFSGSNPFRCYQIWRQAEASGYGTVPECLISQMGLDANPCNYYASQHTAGRRATAQHLLQHNEK